MSIDLRFAIKHLSGQLILTPLVLEVFREERVEFPGEIEQGILGTSSKPIGKLSEALAEFTMLIDQDFSLRSKARLVGNNLLEETFVLFALKVSRDRGQRFGQHFMQSSCAYNRLIEFLLDS